MAVKGFGWRQAGVHGELRWDCRLSRSTGRPASTIVLLHLVEVALSWGLFCGLVRGPSRYHQIPARTSPIHTGRLRPGSWQNMCFKYVHYALAA